MGSAILNEWTGEADIALLRIPRNVPESAVPGVLEEWGDL
jgi:hypothetical protein